MKTHDFFTHVYVKTNAILAVRVIGPSGTNITDLTSGSYTTSDTTIDNLAEVVVKIDGTVGLEEIFGWN